MTWVKIKGKLINLNNVSFVEKNGNKIVISPLLEIELNGESDVDLVYNTIFAVISNNVHFLDLDKALEKRQVKI